MNTAQEHYDLFLGAIYSWMIGDVNIALERNRHFFRQIEIDSVPKGLAVDLGCGSGLQSIPLVELGFSVLAIDTCVGLLAELRSNTHNLPIEIIQDNLLNFAKYLNQPAQLIICMGDTLTHLESLAVVQTLIKSASQALVEEGLLVFTFRDYLSAELQKEQRFIPVQSDDTKIMTCFLEYYQDFVVVYDLLYHKEGTKWKLSTSFYRKLRLDKNWLIQQMNESKLTVVQETVEKGLVSLVIKKGKSLS